MYKTITFLRFDVSYTLQDRSNFRVFGCIPMVLPIKWKRNLSWMRSGLVKWQCSVIGCIRSITLYFVIPASVSGGCQLMVTLSLSAESTLSSRTVSGTKKKIRQKIINQLRLAKVKLFAKWLWDSNPGNIGDRRVQSTLHLKRLEVSKCKINGMVLAPFQSEKGYKLCSFSSGFGCSFRGNYRSL